MASSTNVSEHRTRWHPTFLHARREAIVIFCVWAACLAWTVPYCYYRGYVGGEGPVPTVWGVPSWVFYGVFAPWLAADVFTTWFCFAFMKDDDLGEEPVGEGYKDDAADEEGR